MLISLLILQTGQFKTEFKNIHIHKFLYDCIHHFKFMTVKNDMRVCMSWRSNYIRNKNHKIYQSIKMMHFLAQLSLALMHYKYQDFFILYQDTWRKTKLEEMALPQHFVCKYHICFLLCHLIVRYTSQPLLLLSYDVLLKHELIYLTSCIDNSKDKSFRAPYKGFFHIICMYNYWYYCFFICLHLIIVPYIITFHIMSRHSRSIIHVYPHNILAA